MEPAGQMRLEALARDLASGKVSRRSALGRLFGATAALALPGALFAQSALARCPPSRKCGEKCCPRGARCRRGKCKCKSGLKKCGRKCVDLATDPANCAACGRVCAAGQTCVAGQCTGGSGTEGGGGGTEGGGGETQGAICGNGVRESSEICDGTDLGGATCQSLGFLSGTLGCTANCTYDTSGCVSPSCTTAADCPQGPAGDCQKAVCVSGTCGFEADNADVPADDGNQCTSEICNGGVPSHPAKENGTTCNQNGGTFCDAGACVQCTQASTCPGTDTPCRQRTCASGACGFSYTPAGTPVGMSGGCRLPDGARAYCDGSGGVYTSGTCPPGDVCCAYTTPLMVDGVEYGACC